MWDNRKVLLAAVVFTALHYKVTQSAKLLDMAPDAVDYLYFGCREDALKKFILSDMLNQEINLSKEFKSAWISSNCSNLIPGKRKEHTAALWVYSEYSQFLKTLNKAVKTMGVNVSTYENKFPFKSLHFLLMDSMTRLPQEKCKTFFALQEDTYTVKKGSRVRFGGFTKVYSNIVDETDVDLDGNILFNITSCFFANLGPRICIKEEAVLLSPAEVFTVEDVNEKNDDRNDGTYTEITLRHSELDMRHNCYIFSRSSAEVSTQLPVLMLMALSLLIFNC